MNKEIRYFYLISIICLIAVVVLVILSLLQKRKLVILVCLFFLSMDVVVSCIPCILDYKDAIQKNYLSISGIAIENSKNDANFWRNIEIIDEKSGEKINVKVFTKRVKKGQYFELKYLKNTKFGFVVRRK